MKEKTITKHIVRRTARKSARRIKGFQNEAEMYGGLSRIRTVGELERLGVGIYDSVYVRGPRKNVFRYRVVAVPRSEQPTPGPKRKPDPDGRWR